MAEQTCPNCGKAYQIGDEVCRYCGLVFPFSTVVIPPGSLLQGRYEIQELIHTGGMGYIYLAKDKKLYDRDVIIKQVRESIKDESHRKKLEEEASSMARLANPNIAMILDHFVEGGYYFLVVERIMGKTLGEVYKEREGRFSESEVLEWAITICDVVSYLHSKNVIHRDISPDNIMMMESGALKFIDFGTSHEFRFYGTAGTVGIGKYGYTPPEQWRGKPEQRSDIFAIGATIYYLLTGYLPLSQEYITGKSPQKEDFNPEYPPIRTKNPEISAGMENVLKKALQLDIDKRYGSAAEFSKALRGLEKGKKKKPSRPREKKVRLPKVGPVMKKKAVLFGIAAVIIIAFSGVIIPWSMGVFSQGESGMTPSATTPAYTTTPTAPQSTPTPSTTNIETTTPPTPPPAPYGTIRIATMDFGSESTDPHYYISLWGQMLYDSLISIDETGKYYGVVAENWTVSTDGNTWTFKIRHGIRFHNGDTLTAYDVKFSVDRFGSENSTNIWSNYLSTNYNKVSSAVVDDYTFQYVTDHPESALVEPFSHVYIIPKNYFESVHEDYFLDHPVGSGPWKFVEHIPETSFTVEANTEYWGVVPAYKYVIDIQVPEEATQIDMLKQGEIDIPSGLSTEKIIELQNSGWFTVEIGLPTLANISFQGTWFDNAGPTHDIRIRQAMSYAINRQEICDTYYHGNAVPGGRFYMHPGSWGWTDELGADEYNPDEARRLLEEAGYPEAYADPTIHIYTADDALVEFLQLLQIDWAHVGLQVNIEVLDSGTYFNYMFNYNRLTGTEPNVGWIFLWINPSVHNSIYHAANMYCSWGVHSTGNDPIMDFLFNKASSEFDPSLALQYWSDFQVYARALYINFGICQVQTLMIISSDLGEFTNNTHLGLYKSLAGIQHPE